MSSDQLVNWQMAVAPHIIHIEEVDQAHFAEVDLDTLRWDFLCQVKGVGVKLDGFAAKRNGFVQHISAKIDVLAQGGIAHHVQISKAGDTKRSAYSLAAGFFGIEEELAVLRKAHARVQGQHAGQGGLFTGTLEAVGAGIGRMKGAMRLEDEIRLARDPYPMEEQGGARDMAGFT